MIIAENISFSYPSGKRLFQNLDFSVQDGERAALVGDNGTGKSTLLRIINGTFIPVSGNIQITQRHWTIPQHFGQFDERTIAQVLQVEDKLTALHRIENGSVHSKDFEILNEDWTIHERLHQVFSIWDLDAVSPHTSMSTLSGGQKSRVFLAGISLHQPDLILMDEPSNHLDSKGRKLLYDQIQEFERSFLIVSHDRELLELCDPIYELSSLGIKKYGGNYSFFEKQKEIEIQAIDQQISHSKHSIEAAKKKQRETLERKSRLDARGDKKARKEGMPRIAMNTMRNRAEGSISKLKEVHQQKNQEEVQHLKELKKRQRELKNIKFNLADSVLHSGKVLYEAHDINFSYPNSPLLWTDPLNFVIKSGDRVQITGTNGSGKSTLIQMLDKKLQPSTGTLEIYSNQRFILDQDYTLINRKLTVLEQAEASNKVKKPDHMLKTLLHRYLFEEPVWDQPCASLSGGEIMRLSLCCLALKEEEPDTIILDEPTNNLDMRNIKILTEAISSFKGTLITISHDKKFAEDIGLDKIIELQQVS